MPEAGRTARPGAGRTARPGAEVTDAAMGGRAECVMLSKGPLITDAVRALISILHRMQEHQQTNRAMLRRLEVASHFFEGPATPAPTADSW
ncbi:MAG TPA: hypothetical protein VMN39_09855 [Longimicrobiaceae bacterium]|nr:hypothetical protein [Longimicrobiaceae bacterium]